MFDPETAEFMRAAPALPGLDPADLPRLLTARHAEMAARRLRRVDGTGGAAGDGTAGGEWPLARIADAYEIVVSTMRRDADSRKAAAFVAGMSHQVLARGLARDGPAASAVTMDRGRVHPEITAAAMFLVAEQYADAREAARFIRMEGEEGGRGDARAVLAKGIRDLARGDFRGILGRARRRPAEFPADGPLESRATAALFEGLLVGVELLAAEVLAQDPPGGAAGRFDGARAAFARVLELASMKHEGLGDLAGGFLTAYPGPRHLASLLLAAHDGIASAAVARLEPPGGSDRDHWRNLLRHSTDSAPLLWPNQRRAIEKGFHQNGRSAVLVLPGGAGKTTASRLKIAAVLASGKSVVLIAPAHALVDRLADDLREAFPGREVSSDFDRLFASGISPKDVEVMTPERCLALLSYSPGAFENAGLLVIDECHMLSPKSNLRRALDGMFCVLAFNSVAPEADFLFLSAMLENGANLSKWIEELTERPCVFSGSTWKPNRQARGVVLYEEAAVEKMKRAAAKIQREEDSRKGGRARNPRKATADAMQCRPRALFGPRHDRPAGAAPRCAPTAIFDAPAALTGGLDRDGSICLRPNVNKVAARLAAEAARNGLKAIVFVNREDWVIPTAREIAGILGDAPAGARDDEEGWEALGIELGGLQHAILPRPALAVPYNASMLALERDLAERLFRRADGAKAIVATPALAQGLNLPAEMAILAGDKRSGSKNEGRGRLEAREMLNAAARACRPSGHLASGVVLAIPGAVLGFDADQPYPPGVLDRLESISAEDDRCLSLDDPLQTILDRVDAGSLDDPDVEYALNRLAAAAAPEGSGAGTKTRFPIGRSLAAFAANQTDRKAEFEAKVARLRELVGARAGGDDDRRLAELAARSGAPAGVLRSLRRRIEDQAGDPPRTIPGWTSWTVTWLAEDRDARSAILARDRRAILGAVGRKKDGPLTAEAVKGLEPGILAWLRGEPLCEIERRLGGDPARQATCPRGRELVSRLAPLGLSLAAGLVTRTASEVPAVANGTATPVSVLECLAAGVRRGFDTPDKLAYSDARRDLPDRVKTHKEYAARIRGQSENPDTRRYSKIAEEMEIYVKLLT